LSIPHTNPADWRREAPAAKPRRRFARATMAASVLLAALASPFAAAPAHAWSAPGHRIVGLVAEQFLDGDTRRALYQIAGEESLAEVGLWLDVERDRLRTEWPGSERWHYDNRPVCDPSTPFASRCAQGDCPTAAIDRHLRVLADTSAPRERRLDALRVVVHVLADVHQPLHAGDNRDRGGNDINVDMGPRREPRSLHGIWDRQVVEYAMRGESERAFARQLARENRRDVRRLQSGSLTDWMEESYVYARDFVYPGVPSFACGQSPPFIVRLDDEYRREAAKIARERLARAGIRLAGVLNETLGS
jgi:hypothetical protein